MEIKFNTVTWYSKLLAAIVIFGILPFLMFYIGTQYQETKEVLQQSPIMVAQEDHSIKAATDESSVCLDEEGKAIDLDNANQMEMNYCAGQDLLAANNKMQMVYTGILMQIELSNKQNKDDADMLAINKKTKLDTLDAQKSWLAYRDAACRAESNINEGGSIQPLIIETCMSALTDQHTKELQNILTSISPQ